tara:strand:+ start:1152 stop:1667 length:516 start_codon:yes stop_codon:yes gene_type:complete
MFKVPYYFLNIDKWTDHKSSVLSNLKVKDPSKVPKNTDDSVITSYWDNFDYNDHIEFLNMLHPYIAPITKEMGVERITRLWWQTANSGDYHTAHDHGMEGWSAVFYAQFDPEVHKSTTFYRPYPAPMNVVPPIFNPKVKEGDLFMFPSFILHEAPINKSDVPRTIISFNLL